MKLAIFGIGAMGSLFGARLAPYTDVTLIGHWPEQVEALRRGPLHVLRADGSTYETRVRVTDSVGATHESPLRAAFDGDPADVALILTKAGKTDQAALAASHVLKPDGVAVTLQNGIGNYEILEQRVGAGRAALGTTTQGAAMVEPGVVREGGAGLTHLATRAEIDGNIRRLAELLEQAAFKTEVVGDVSGLVWGKLAINAAINPLTALLRVPNGALLDSPEARRIMEQAALEVAAVAEAQGIRLPFEDADIAAAKVAQATAVNLSSMLQDARRGAETEIEAICGAVLREGQRLGVPTPTNAMLYYLIKAMEQIKPHRVDVS